MIVAEDKTLFSRQFVSYEQQQQNKAKMRQHNRAI